MPRRSKKQMLAERQDPAAPWLFDEDQLPLREDVVAMIKAGAHKSLHRGVRLLENEELCRRMVELLMAHWGVKRIATKLGVSHHTIKAARQELVNRGEMAPWKQRVVGTFEDIIEEGAESYLQDMREGKVPAAQKPVGVGIFADKRADALGEARGAELAQSAQVVAGITVERWRAFLGTIETHSGVPSPKAQEIEAKPGLAGELAGTLPPTGGGIEPGTAVKLPTEMVGGDTSLKEKGA